MAHQLLVHENRVREAGTGSNATSCAAFGRSRRSARHRHFLVVFQGRPVSRSQVWAAACQDRQAACIAVVAWRRMLSCWSGSASWRARPVSACRSSSLLWPMMAAASAWCRQQVAADADGHSASSGVRRASWRSRVAVAAAPAQSSAGRASLAAGGWRGGGRFAGMLCSRTVSAPGPGWSGPVVLGQAA